MGGLSNGLILDHHVPKTVGSQIGKHILCTSCGVVEQPDHHYGDDLVLEYDVVVMMCCFTVFHLQSLQLFAIDDEQ